MTNSFFISEAELKWYAKKFDLSLSKGELNKPADVRYHIENESDFESFLLSVTGRMRKLFYVSHYFDVKNYKITKDINDTTYGEYTERVQKKVDAYNKEIIEHDGKLLSLKLATVSEGYAFSAMLLNPNKPNVDNDWNALRKIELDIDGLKEFLFKSEYGDTRT